MDKKIEEILHRKITELEYLRFQALFMSIVKEGKPHKQMENWYKHGEKMTDVYCEGYNDALDGYETKLESLFDSKVAACCHWPGIGHCWHCKAVENPQIQKLCPEWVELADIEGK